MGQRLKVNTKFQQYDGEELVSPTGQYFNNKTLSVCILSVLETEVPIDDSCALELLRDLFLPINPRFSSIMVTDHKGVKHWKRVEVNLQDHVRIPSYPEGLTAQAYDDYFDEYLTKLAMDPLPQYRPLWELHITKYPTTKAAGHIIFKLHHALGDGFSLMGALLSCLQRADNPSIPLTFPSLKASTSESSTTSDIFARVPKFLSAIYCTPVDFGWSLLKSILIADDKTPVRSADADVELKPVRITTIALPLDKIKQIKTKLQVTINDVVTGIVFYGTRLYMQETDLRFGNSESTALVLLNTRNISTYKSVEQMVNTDTTSKWGNQFAFLHVGLPKVANHKSANPLDFVSETQRSIKRKRESLAVYLTGQCLEILRRLKGSEEVARHIHSTLKQSSMTVSNMIGPVEKMSVGNHPCKGLYFMVVGVPQSLTITILSYMGTLRITVGAEKGFLDSRKFNSCIENAFESIYREALERG